VEQLQGSSCRAAVAAALEGTSSDAVQRHWPH
jgi:hypothetical protein